MKLENIDGFSFDFPDAVTVFKFDETDPAKPTFHGVPMKAVDIIVEMKDVYLGFFRSLLRFFIQR